MALINCPECDREVSDLAPSCPGCGVPIANAVETAAAGVQLTTVQETSKKLKSHQLLSLIIFCPSVVWLIASLESENTLIPNVLVSASVLWYIVTRIRIWWHHG